MSSCKEAYHPFSSNERNQPAEPKVQNSLQHTRPQTTKIVMHGTCEILIFRRAICHSHATSRPVRFLFASATSQIPVQPWAVWLLLIFCWDIMYTKLFSLVKYYLGNSAGRFSSSRTFLRLTEPRSQQNPRVQRIPSWKWTLPESMWDKFH